MKGYQLPYGSWVSTATGRFDVGPEATDFYPLARKQTCQIKSIELEFEGNPKRPFRGSHVFCLPGLSRGSPLHETHLGLALGAIDIAGKRYINCPKSTGRLGRLSSNRANWGDLTRTELLEDRTFRTDGGPPTLFGRSQHLHAARGAREADEESPRNVAKRGWTFTAARTRKSARVLSPVLLSPVFWFRLDGSIVRGGSLAGKTLHVCGS